MITLTDTLVIDGPGQLTDATFAAGPGLIDKPMILVNPSAAPFRMKRITLKCEGLAKGGISAWDLESCVFEDIVIDDPIIVGMYLVGIQSSMQRVRVTNLRVNGRTSNAATGLCLNGTYPDSDPSKAANVSFCRFEDCRFIMGNGIAVDILDGDNNVFINTHCIFYDRGTALYHGPRGSNTFIGFEPSFGKIDLQSKNISMTGYSTINGGMPWPGK